MKKTLIYGVLCLSLIFSCSKEDDYKETSVANDLALGRMMSFDSMEDLKNTLDLFSTFNATSDYENWSAQHDFTPLYYSDKVSIEEQNNTPFTFLFILNEDKEFEVGNKIISYADGLFYEKANDNPTHVTRENHAIGHFEQELHKVGEETVEGTERTVSIGTSNGSEYKPSESWKEYVRVTYASKCKTPYNKSLRFRLVQYLSVETVNLGGITQTNLIFKLRMSQKTGSGWKYNNTTTERRYNVNVSGNYALKYYTGTTVISGSYSINNQNGCSNTIKGTEPFPIALHPFFNPTNLSLYHWEVSLNGTVWHKVNGDVVANEYNETLNW